MILRLTGWILAGWLVLACPAVAQQDAEALVKGVTDEVLSILREDKAIQGGDRARAMALIEKRIAPHFDFERMTGLAVGRAWRDASDPQRDALIREFRELLTRTYANALTAYRDQTVEFKPTRSSEGGDAVVQSQIVQPGAPPVPLDYRLSQKDGGWKVYDVVVNNVSLITSYRGSFATEVSNGGIEGLIKALQARNRNPGSAPS